MDALGTQPSTEGFVPGSPFLVERLERGSLLDEEVEMTWTCDGEVAVDQLDLAQGYSFSLAELGCAIDWPQRLTVRPSGTDLRRLVTVELYGIPSTAVTVPLRDSFDGEQFKFAQRGLVVEGALLGAGDALTVRLDGVKFAGLPICIPFTSLPP